MDNMKWTIRKVKDEYYGSIYIVRFNGESPRRFPTRFEARAYVNDRVFTALGF